MRLTEIKIYAQVYIAVQILFLILFKVHLLSISQAASVVPNSFQILGILVSKEGIHEKQLRGFEMQPFDQKIFLWPAQEGLHHCPAILSVSHSVLSNSLQCHGLYSPWNSPGQNTGVGSLSLLQGIIPTQGLNPGVLHCRWILYQLSHKGSPRILEWVAYLFSSGSSWPRNPTSVSCIAGGFFTTWAISIQTILK